jgi:hypothetical protein
MAGSKLTWTIVQSVSTMVAVALTKKVMDSGWRFVTGNEPPEDPENPDTSWIEAVAWVVASGVGVVLARRLATQGAIRRWQSWTGDLPPGRTKS